MGDLILARGGRHFGHVLGPEVRVRARLLEHGRLILGILFQFLIVAVGLGAVLATSELAFTLVKYAGVVYLIYLACARSAPTPRR